MSDGNDSSENVIFNVLSVDRRLLVLKEFLKKPVLRGADIAKNINRSLQNVSRALNELEEIELVQCTIPENQTWKKYILTKKAKRTLDQLHIRKFI